MNRIKDQFKNIDENKLISLRECLMHILSKIIKDKKLMESYKYIIDKTSKNNWDLKNIKNYCDIFICIYKKKWNIKFFIKNILLALEGKKILDESLFNYFHEKLNEIYLEPEDTSNNNNNDINNQENEREVLIKSNLSSNENNNSDLNLIENKILINKTPSAPLIKNKNYDEFKISKQKNKLSTNNNNSKNLGKYLSKILILENQNKKIR